MTPLTVAPAAMHDWRRRLRRARARIASLRHVARSAHGEGGFTLIEVLVAILTGVIVTGAAFAILEVSLHQSTNIADRVSATQRGRTAMEKILLELHSSCVAASVTPIQKSSGSTSIQFISQTGTTPYFESIAKHEISLSAGKLTDATYQSNGGAAPKWTFPSTPTSKRTLLSGVTQSGSSGTTPVFEYFKYIGGSISSTPQTAPLTEAEAKETAKVTVSFTTTPESGDSSGPSEDRAIALSNTAVLRFDPASVSSVNTPCA